MGYDLESGMFDPLKIFERPAGAQRGSVHDLFIYLYQISLM